MISDGSEDMIFDKYDTIYHTIIDLYILWHSNVRLCILCTSGKLSVKVVSPTCNNLVSYLWQ